eukprot:CAMPEP_0116873828 /NCGR_PEP_ID=MMETSP0463-20121206/5138_1 /TAXON_ID=181622 /ORGANISM="Strombidinopsis sp, Strain SopsisLIS2011" /LENGTH=60 /DNA_ID=CAMNT_0004516559 /DNA_START=1953 /DNA_END=2135 /DNA_ORIENTATION=-
MATTKNLTLKRNQFNVSAALTSGKAALIVVKMEPPVKDVTKPTYFQMSILMFHVPDVTIT